MANSFYRDKSRGMIGGVCAGLADYFAVSPILLRLIFVLWALATGTGVMAYIILWIILPEKTVVDAPRGEAFRQNVSEIRTEARNWGQELQGIFSGKADTRTTSGRRVVLLGALLIVMGLLFLVDSLGLLGWFRLDQLWPVALILIGMIMLNRALRS